MTGTVLQGINNIFTVRTAGAVQLYRLKGKILNEGSQGPPEYNPLAPGDEVVLEEGQIVSRLPRANQLYRWNRKRNCMQIAAANVDQLLLFGSICEPPLRPRFIDRALVMSEWSRLPAVVIINKADLGGAQQDMERIAVYQSLGYRVLMISAHTGQGLPELADICRGSRSVLFGQSGVGKSTCINSLFPAVDLKTGDVSRKHNRGRHTTNYGRLLTAAELGADSAETEIIDTPGIRELHVMGFSEVEIAYGFREIRARADRCSYSSCTHLHEPDCAVRLAVQEKSIHPDRYTSYANTVADMQDLSRQFGVPEFET